MTSLARTLALAVVWALASCGGSAGPGAVTSPFLPQDDALFDGGVEFLDNPEKLTGRWREDWERELEARVSRADVIFVGELVATRAGADAAGGSFQDLSFSAERALKGSVGGVLELRSRTGDPGYRTLARGGDRLLGKRYIAYLKWVEGEDGAVRARFHLAHASGFVLGAVEFQLGTQ